MQTIATTVAQALMKITRSKVRESARIVISGALIADSGVIDANAKSISDKIKMIALVLLIALPPD